jgi:hypothetical protein
MVLFQSNYERVYMTEEIEISSENEQYLSIIEKQEIT